MSSIILFEPICRGSRLQILANFVQAIRETSDRKIIIVTRSDYMTPHFSELLSAYDNIFIEIAKANLSNAWIKSLSSNEFKCFLDSLSTVVNENPESDLYFMALDDYFRASLINIFYLNKICRKTRNSIVKYRVEYLFMREGFKSIILSYLTKTIISMLHGTLICFDERLTGMKLANKNVEVIPDPWFGKFSPSHRSIARKKYGFSEKQKVILTVGRQDKRKGIDTIINTFPYLIKNNPDVILFVVGKIDVSFEGDFLKLKEDYREKIYHLDCFIDESELPIVFSCADIFILPYSKEFTSSSGTLSRALASGVPVVGSDHGLVGFRILENQFGFVFKAGRAEQLSERITHLINLDDVSLKKLQVNGYKFCDECSIDSFVNRVNKVIFSEGAI